MSLLSTKTTKICLYYIITTVVYIIRCIIKNICVLTIEIFEGNHGKNTKNKMALPFILSLVE